MARDKDPTSFFAWQKTVFPELCVEKIALSFSKSIWPYMWGFIWDFNSILFFCVCLHACTTLFWLLCLCKKFWNQKMWGFQLWGFLFLFFFFFRIALDIQGTLRIHMKFRMDFFKFLQKMPLGFWYGLHEICGSLFMLLTCWCY